MIQTSTVSSLSSQEGADEVFRQRRWLSFMFSKEVPPVPLDDERIVYPLERSNFLSRILFWWITPLMIVGYKRTITSDDLFKLDDNMEIGNIYQTFSKNLQKRVSYYQNKHVLKKCSKRGETLATTTVDRIHDLEDFILPKGALFMALCCSFWFQYVKSIIQVCVQGVATALQPLILKKLTEFVEKKSLGLNPAVGKGIGYSLGNAAFLVFTGVIINHAFYNAMSVGAKAKSILVKSVLTKSFVLNDLGRHKYPEGKINALITTDLNRIDFASISIPILAGAPFSLAITIGFLVHNLGVYALIGIGLFFVCFLILGSMIPAMKSFRKEAQEFTDKRVTLKQRK
ncbi:unnamed protein product [Ambrosiozyma monospora]|uniref:Unnamed protein product n=1 Tax=Ambrosiozyma monospora TaxID=43982 RepID=A0ACB5T6Z0_AMBMO|nr:unnamed protein product [Ambrosiozyma monospora]